MVSIMELSDTGTPCAGEGERGHGRTAQIHGEASGPCRTWFVEMGYVRLVELGVP